MHASDSSSPHGNFRKLSTFPGKAAKAVNGVANPLLTFLMALSLLALSLLALSVPVPSGAASLAQLEQELASAEADLAVQLVPSSGDSSDSSGRLSELPSETDSESDIELEEKFETELWLPPQGLMSLYVEVRERTSAPSVRALENQWLRDGLERPPRA